MRQAARFQPGIRAHAVARPVTVSAFVAGRRNEESVRAVPSIGRPVKNRNTMAQHHRVFRNIGSGVVLDIGKLPFDGGS
jgi:hypothetical protein